MRRVEVGQEVNQGANIETSLRVEEFVLFWSFWVLVRVLDSDVVGESNKLESLLLGSFPYFSKSARVFGVIEAVAVQISEDALQAAISVVVAQNVVN